MLLDVCFGGSHYLFTCFMQKNNYAIFHLYNSFTVEVSTFHPRCGEAKGSQFTAYHLYLLHGRTEWQTVLYSTLDLGKAVIGLKLMTCYPEELRVVGLVVLLSFVRLLTLKTLKKDRSEIWKERFLEKAHL